MPVLRKDGPYIWVTWLNKLITGDQSCEWAYWFRTQFDSNSWTRAERVGNLARWQVGHTDLLNRKARELREEGYTVTREAQNHFTIKGDLATLAGKPDLVARQGDLVRIIDVKAGQPRAADQVQVMIYMYLLPLARPELQGAAIRGQVVYGDREVDIEPDALDATFVQALQEQVQRLAAREEAVKVPSWSECQFCDMSQRSTAPNGWKLPTGRWSPPTGSKASPLGIPGT